MKKIPSIAAQTKRNLKDIKRHKQGKLTFHTFRVNVPEEDIDPVQIRNIREDVLHVSQRVLAESMAVSVRTVQGWECGRSRPFGAARRLLQLMHSSPSVRRAVLHGSDAKH